MLRFQLWGPSSVARGYLTALFRLLGIVAGLWPLCKGRCLTRPHHPLPCHGLLPPSLAHSAGRMEVEEVFKWRGGGRL